MNPPPRGQQPPQQSSQQSRQPPPQQWHQPPSPQTEPPSGGPTEPDRSAPSPGADAGVGTARSVATGPWAGDPPSRSASARRTGSSLAPVTIEDIVETDVLTAERDTPIGSVVEDMAERDVGSAVIVEDDTPVGIVTDRQVALSLTANPDVSDRTVDDILSEDLVTGTMDMTVFEVLRRLGDEGVRRLPVVDDDGSLEGIVTLDDLLVLLGTELDNAVGIIEAQSPRL